MSSEGVQSLLQRYKRAKSVSDLWQPYWDLAYQYVFPDRNLFTQYTQAQRKNIQQCDLTAFNDAVQFVSQLHLGLTPLYSQWAILVPGDDVPEYLEQNIRQGLQAITKTIFSVIDNSNFNLVINEAYYDLVLGTGVFLCLEGQTNENPVDFRYVPLQDISIEESESSSEPNVFRTFDKLPVIDIPKLWGGATLPQVLLDEINEPTGMKVQIVESTIWDHQKQMFIYRVTYPEGNVHLYELMSESSPWIIFRWNKLRGESYGRGPAISALPTILTLNQHYKFIMRSNEISAYPIFMGWSDGIFNPNTVNLYPGTIIPLGGPMGTNMPLQPLPQSGQPQLAENLMQDLRQQIHAVFFAEPLGSIGDDPNMTATEINIRNQMGLEKKAPAMGRLQVELAQKLLKRIVFILKTKGMVPNIKINNKQITISYKNDLAKLASIQKVNDLVQAAQTLQSIMGPQAALLAFKAAQLPKFVGESYDVDLSLINDPATIQQIQQNIAQASTQQQPGAQGGAQLPTPPAGGLPAPTSVSGPQTMQ